MHSLRLQTLNQPFHAKIHSTTSTSTSAPGDNNGKPHFSLSRTDDKFSDALTSLRTSIDARKPQLGSCLHANTLKLGLHTDVSVANSILDMYAKCGRVEDAFMLFENMPYRTVVSWTSMFWAYCLVELPDEALSLFLKMLEMLQQSNEYTLAVLLRACAQKGEGRLVQSIHSYGTKYGFTGDDFLQIDAYVKCGMVETAEKLSERGQSRDVISWSILISGSVAITVWRVALSNLYPNSGRWSDVAKVRAEMQGPENFKKEGGWSILKLEGSTFGFMAGDTKHPKREMICEVFDELRRHMSVLSIH